MSAGGPSSGLPPLSPPHYPSEMDRYLRDQQQQHHHEGFNGSRNFQQEPSYEHASYQPDGNQQSNNGQHLHNNGPNAKPDQAARLRQAYNTRSASPLSRPPLFSPTLDGERSSSQHRPPSVPNATSPPPRTNVTSPRYLLDSAKQQQNWMPRSNAIGPLDFHPSISPVSFSSIDRPHSSMSDNAFTTSQDSSFRPVVSAASSGSGSNKESEFSIFVGDLSPDLREEDLVTQFLQPPPWLPNHPFAAALIHAQQAQGIWQPGVRLGPAPFLSTKSAKIMTDPVTNASKGYGFVRFNLEADCNRALVEMQGVVVTPSNGMSPGRPLRVSTATPKNRSMPSSEPNHHHLQMPRPHNPAQSATSFLYANPNGNGASPSTANTPLHQQQPLPPPQHPHHPVQQHHLPTQQASPSQMPPSFVSPTSPTSPFDGPNGGLPHQQRPYLPMHAGFSAPDMQHLGPQQSHTPPTAPSNSQQASAIDSAADPNNTTVFVGGLSSLISEATLRRYFEHFGEITYVKIPSGKGCGFVQFVRKQDAENAIQRMNGFPILNSKIRLSWGRSQGDKAAAAAAQTMAQYAQLGQLAGLAGLSTLSPSQLAQLAGLGSALSAAQANTQVSNGYANNEAAAAALANDPLSTLARQLAAANTGGAAGPPGMGGMSGPLPPFLQQQPNGHAAPPHHAPPPYQGNGHNHNGFDMDPRAGPRSHPGNGFRSPDHVQNDHAIRPRPPFPQGLTSPQSDSELAHAFANLDFDDGGARSMAKGGPQSFSARPPQPQPGPGQVDRFGRGYNRDPNAFMFSPFSPSDSPLVGGKTDLPHSAASQHYDEPADPPRFANPSASPTR